MSRDIVSPGDYEHPKAKQFVEDMLEAGLEPYHYEGRNYYHGPAVNVDDVTATAQETEVKVQWDGMGKGYVVYPRTDAWFDLRTQPV